MFNDTKRIRNHRYNVRLDDYEFDILNSIAVYQGTNIAAVMREMAIQHAIQSILPPGNPAQITIIQGKSEDAKAAP